LRLSHILDIPHGKIRATLLKAHVRTADVLEGVMMHGMPNDVIWSLKTTEERVKKDMESVATDDEQVRLASVAKSAYGKLKVELDVSTLKLEKFDSVLH
jgi:hypothetical protein